MYVGSGHFFLVQYFWGFSEKLKFVLGMKILWIFFGGLHKIGLYLGVISMHFCHFNFQTYSLKIQDSISNFT